MALSYGLINESLKAGVGDHLDNWSEYTRRITAEIRVVMKDVDCFAVFTDGSFASSAILSHFFLMFEFAMFVSHLPDEKTCSGLILVSHSIQAARWLSGSVVRRLFKTQIRGENRPIQRTFITGMMLVMIETMGPQWLPPLRSWSKSPLGAVWVNPPTLLAIGSTPQIHVGDFLRGRWAPVWRAGELDLENKKMRKLWPNLNYEKMVVSTHNVQPFIYEEGSGVEFEIIKIIAKTLNMKLHINPVGSWKLMISSLRRGPGDIAGGIYMSIRFLKLFDYGYPWENGCSTLLVPKPLHIRGDWSALLQPYGRWVWLAIVGSLLTMGFTQQIFMEYKGAGSGRTMNMKFFKERGDTWQRRSTGLLEALGMLLATAAPPPHRAFRPAPRRALLLLWSLAGILIANGYCCGLLSHLTAPQATRPIDTLGDLVEAKISWGTSVNIPPIFFLDNSISMHRRALKLFDSVNTTAELSERVANGRYAVLGSYMGRYFSPLGITPDKENILNLRVMRESLRCDQYALVYRPFSELRPWGDKVTQLVLEAGIIDHLLQKTLRTNMGPTILSLKRDGRGVRKWETGASEATPLRLQELITIFVVFRVGICVAGLVFVAEIAPSLLRLFVAMIFRCKERVLTSISKKNLSPFLKPVEKIRSPTNINVIRIRDKRNKHERHFKRFLQCRSTYQDVTITRH